MPQSTLFDPLFLNMKFQLRQVRISYFHNFIQKYVSLFYPENPFVMFLTFFDVLVNIPDDMIKIFFVLQLIQL